MMCFATSTFAQNSFPTSESKAIWCIGYSFHGYHEQRPDAKYCYGLIGDTTFNVNDTSFYTYSKLYEISDTILSEENTIRYMGGFRNEGQKVFFKCGWQEMPEILLYDFSAEIGDTVWHNAIGYCSKAGSYNLIYGEKECYSVIYYIDTYNGIKTVRIRDDGSFDNAWIEGVGGYGGFFWHLLQLRPIGDYYETYLECFQHNDTIVYPNLLGYGYCKTCPCNGQVGIKNFDTENYSYLYQNQPNPFSESTKIKYFISENTKESVLLIFDIQGILIKQIPIYDKGESETIINANELQTGIYIYQLVIDGKEIDSKKMILTK